MGNPILKGKLPILIVEDSDEDFEATKRAFDRINAQNPILRCLEGGEALDYLHNQGQYKDKDKYPLPGIILLDLNLPGTDGRAVLQEIKNNPKLKNIPVVILTTSNADQDIISCYGTGANSYIQKPIDVKELFKAISMLKDYWFDVVILPK